MNLMLTDSQKKAKDKMDDFLKNSYSKGEHFVLTGGPGTGKTFLTKYVTLGYRKRIGGATISHAAKNILRQHIGSHVSCYTLANLLGMTMNIRNDGTFAFRKSTKTSSKFHRFDAILIDEISMIDDPLYDIIMTEANENNVKIIAMGDRYQLPPVEQDHDSKFFHDIDATLIEPMRFQGPIENLASVFRKEIQNINEDNGFDKWAINSNTKREDSHDTILDSGYSFTNKVLDIVEKAADDFKINKDNINHSRILAYKNDSVDKLNTSIRYLIYGTGIKQFEEDEIVISNSNYRPFNEAEPLIHNGKVLRVHSFVEDEGPYEIPCLKMKFKNFNSDLYPSVYVVSTAKGGIGTKKYEAKLRQLKYAASKDPEALKAYKEFVDQFAYFDYAYAVNLYRAQGSTIENAYVFEGEVMNVKPLTWKQKFQALYVAVTRPRKNLVIYNKDF